MRFFILALVLAGTANATTIGIRNHNPGNIISRHPMAWEGAVGKDAWGHIRFKNEVCGLKAIKKVLESYGKKGLDTPHKIAIRWVGPGTQNKKEFADYMLKFTSISGFQHNQKLDMLDINTLSRLARGIVVAENSKSPYTEAMWHKAFRGLDG